MSKDLDSSARVLIVKSGCNIARTRKMLGLTQRELSANARIGYRYYQAIEGGRINMTLSTVCKIAGALKVPASDLLVIKDVDLITQEDMSKNGKIK